MKGENMNIEIIKEEMRQHVNESVEVSVFGLRKNIL